MELVQGRGDRCRGNSGSFRCKSWCWFRVGAIDVGAIGVGGICVGAIVAVLGVEVGSG